MRPPVGYLCVWLMMMILLVASNVSAKEVCRQGCPRNYWPVCASIHDRYGEKFETFNNLCLFKSARCLNKDKADYELVQTRGYDESCEEQGLKIKESN